MKFEDAVDMAGTPFVFVDGDFGVEGAQCPHYCSPTCHPAQVGPDWKYGCRHPAWPQNQAHGFCPIVYCGGNPQQCEKPQEG
jgi:hypothetical protein